MSFPQNCTGYIFLIVKYNHVEKYETNACLLPFLYLSLITFLSFPAFMVITFLRFY